VTDLRFAFLRAINTGSRRLTNDALLVPFRDLGFVDVAAHQAAGNVVFRSDLSPAELEPLIAGAVADAHGFEAPTFVRTADEVADAVATIPFTAEQLAATEGRVQITFLAATPSPATTDELLALVPDEDLVAVAGRHWWWLPRAGVSDSRLPVARIEAIVGPMTMRTLATVERMLARFAA
jgi:uncharacterized protein (DUF1697 family)